jgi:bifunctional polynucleotide phosphatase/kinase
MKVSAVFGQLDLPLSIYAATEKDIYRKPRTGMWKELLGDYGLHLPGDLNLKQSIFVGDAGGRIAGDGKPKDFSCSDRYGWNIVLLMYEQLTPGRNFAENIGINFYTPEEIFLQETPRPFTRTFDPSGYLVDAAEGER